MGAGHHDARGAGGARFGDHARRAPDRRRRIDGDADALARQPAGARAHGQHGDPDAAPLQRAAHRSRVGDQHRRGPGALRRERLLAERARAALDQRHLAAPQRRERLGRAAEADRAHGPRDRAAARELQRAGLVRARPGGQPRLRALAQPGDRDLLDRDAVARGPQPAGHVVGGRPLAGRAGRAVAAVLVGDPLQRGQVLSEPGRSRSAPRPRPAGPAPPRRAGAARSSRLVSTTSAATTKPTRTAPRTNARGMEVRLPPIVSAADKAGQARRDSRSNSHAATTPPIAPNAWPCHEMPGVGTRPNSSVLP